MNPKTPQTKVEISLEDPKQQLRRKLEEILGEDLEKVAGGYSRATVDPDNRPMGKQSS
jgi:hypothetical protein